MKRRADLPGAGKLLKKTKAGKWRAKDHKNGKKRHNDKGK